VPYEKERHSLVLSTWAQRKSHVRTQKEGAVFSTEREASPDIKPADTLILDFQLPELWENKFLFFNSPSP
jgi:hypothetical protein